MAAGGMTISAFARAGGVGVETVRYYQRRGLLAVPGSGRSSFRVYDTELLRRLRFIRRLQSAGFTLQQIGDLLGLDRTADRLRVQAVAAAKLEELRGRIRELRSVARTLEQLLEHCRQAPAGERCPIVEAFDPLVSAPCPTSPGLTARGRRAPPPAGGSRTPRRATVRGWR